MKSKANAIYNNLKSKNVKIIPINSKYYPQNLKNIFSPPLSIFVIGDIYLTKKIKIYVYENSNITKYASKIVELLYSKVLNENKYLILNRNLHIKGVNLISEFCNMKCYNGVNILYNSNNNYIRDLEIKSGILDLIIIPEADYKKDISILVDSFLELGKEVGVFPSEIFNKNAYFSNYLIKNGAYVLTNIYQINNLLNNL